MYQSYKSILATTQSLCGDTRSAIYKNDTIERTTCVPQFIQMLKSTYMGQIYVRHYCGDVFYIVTPLLNTI